MVGIEKEILTFEHFLFRLFAIWLVNVLVSRRSGTGLRHQTEVGLNRLPVEPYSFDQRRPRGIRTASTKRRWRWVSVRLRKLRNWHRVFPEGTSTKIIDNEDWRRKGSAYSFVTYVKSSNKPSFTFSIFFNLQIDEIWCAFSPILHTYIDFLSFSRHIWNKSICVKEFFWCHNLGGFSRNNLNNSLRYEVKWRRGVMGKIKKLGS